MAATNVDAGDTNQEESAYLTMLAKIRDEGHVRQTRNGITRSLFAAHLCFDLGRSFPLLTTKKMFLRGVFEELKFFVLGQTDTKLLERKGVNIWRGNTSRAFLDSVGLPYQEGQMGPMYGHQWRRFGAPIEDESDPRHSPDREGGEREGKRGLRGENPPENGIDQLQNVIDLLSTDRFSRRILMTTYNPAQTDQGVLPPCHGIAVQFGVEGNRRLCCHMYQRSCDAFLGCPFNIASYALLVHLVCALVKSDPSQSLPDLVPGTLTMSFGDYHLYDQHLDAVNTQTSRTPNPFPQLHLRVNGVNMKPLTCLDDVAHLEMTDLVLTDYNCHPSIQAPMIA